MRKTVATFAVLGVLGIFLFSSQRAMGADPWTAASLKADLSVPKPSTKMPAGALNVKNFGAKGDAKTDDLAAFQRAVAAVPLHGTLWVPAGRYVVDVSKTNNIHLKSFMKFAMHPDAILMVKPNALKRYYVLTTGGAESVDIYGGQLLGDRNHHKASVGEWGYGIQIGTGTKHIRIHDMKISNMWGDGICTGGYPDDVLILRVLSTNNRRQAISITTGTNIRVLNSELSFTNGTKPMYGIDIEPDGADKGNYARYILIQGNYFHDNVAGGVQPYKGSQHVTIANNRFSTGKEGVYMVGAANGRITGNTFDHISDEYIHFGANTDYYQVDNNVFYRTDMNSALTSITGLQGVATSYIHDKSSTHTRILTNRYAN
jgi:parallel beta-helix repeat protein